MFLPAFTKRFLVGGDRSGLQNGDALISVFTLK
jgi:hypothetical protein